MNLKKFISGISALTIAASAFAGMAVTASAEDVVTNVVPTELSYMDSSHGDTVYYTEDANVANGTVKTGLSGLAWTVGPDYKNFKTGTFAVAKFDLSSYKSLSSGKTVSTATFKVTANGTDAKTSDLNVGPASDTSWTASTLSWNNKGSLNAVTSRDDVINLGATPLNTDTDRTANITSWFNSDDDGIITVVMVASTARSQELKNISVDMTVTDAPQYSYAFKAFSGTTDLNTTIASGTVNANASANAALTKYIAAGGKYYVLNDDTVTNYSKTETIDEDNKIVPVYYTEATDVDYAVEGELFGLPSDNSSYSGGAYGAVSGGKAYSFGTFEAGTYTATFYLVERGDRGFYLRSSAGNAAGNVIAYADINKNSAAGVYTVDFTLTEDTTVYLTGYTTDSSTNQSAGFDYVTIKKTGDYVHASADVNATPTIYNTYADPIVKAYTFEATPTLIGSDYQALSSVTVTVSVDGYPNRTATKTAEDFGTISGPMTFAILIGGDVTPSNISVSVE